MSGRSTLVTISVLFFAYCAFIAVFTFLGRNRVVYHLTTNYMLAYGAVYIILSPFGISGVLGVSHRRKSLIRGFLFQYWIGTLLLTAVNIVSLFIAHKYQARTLRKCLTPYRANLTQAILSFCIAEVHQAQLAAFIFTIVEAGIMTILGILLFVLGKRECEDIQIDEETSTLLLGRRQTITFPENTETTEQPPLRPQNVLRVDRVPGLYEKGFNENQYYYPQTMMYNDPAAGGGGGRQNMQTSGLSRHPAVTGNYMPSTAMAQNDPELTRNPTVASNYTTTTTATTIPQNSRGLVRNPTGASTQNGLTRNPTVASNYTTTTAISQNSRGLSRNPTGATVASNYTTTTTASLPLNRQISPPPSSPLPPPPPQIATPDLGRRGSPIPASRTISPPPPQIATPDLGRRRSPVSASQTRTPPPLRIVNPDLGRGSPPIPAAAPEQSYSSRTRAQQLSPTHVQPFVFEDTNANNSFIPSSTTEYWRPGMAKTLVPHLLRTPPYSRG